MTDINDFNIADFAENLIKEDKKSGAKIVPTQSGYEQVTGPDYSNAPPLEEDFVSNILEKSFGVKTEKKVIKEEKQEVSKKTPEEYIVKLVSLIKEAQALINEMTSCGSIGVNQASGGFAPPKKKKKVKKKYSKVDYRKYLK